jgi:hypothetical protein
MCTNVISILIKLSNIIFKFYSLGFAAFTILAIVSVSLFSYATLSPWLVYDTSINKLGKERYKMILWQVGITILLFEAQQCLLLSCMSLSNIQKCWVLHNNAFTVNLYYRQQCEFYLPVLERYYTKSNNRNSRTLHIKLKQTKVLC